MHPTGLFWFRRDLRLSDNTALQHALDSVQSLYTIFIFDSTILSKLVDQNDRRLTFIWQSLCELKKSLQERNSDLFILYGDPISLIPEIANLVKADIVFTNRDYEEYALTRDNLVQAGLSALHKQFLTFKDHLIFEFPEVVKPDNTAYKVFTPYKKAWVSQLNTNRKKYTFDHTPSDQAFQHLAHRKNYFGIQSQLEQRQIRSIKALLELGFTEASDLLVLGGEKAGNQSLHEFASSKITHYKEQRDYPSLRGTSGLSTHLRFGTVSIRQCLRVVLTLLYDPALDLQSKENIETWLSELIWREFYSMILQAFPFVEKASFKAEYKDLIWSVNSRLLQAWKDGLTGYPIVDAGMRELKQTGLMHNRVRMITASFLSKNLLINWQEGEAHFARYLLDFELASNNGGWQWASSTGTDAVPYFRIFNPQLQSKKFDPSTEYIKAFVPELRNIPSEQIHNLGFQILGYPAPIVRQEAARAAVLSLFKTAKEKRVDSSE